MEYVTCSMQWNCTTLENMEGDFCIIDLESTVRPNSPPCWVNCVLLGKQLCSLSASGPQSLAKYRLLAGNREHGAAVKQKANTHDLGSRCFHARGVRVFAMPVLPRVDGAGDGVVAVVHGVWSPAVAPHALRAVVSGHGQVLREGSRKKGA